MLIPEQSAVLEAHGSGDQAIGRVELAQFAPALGTWGLDAFPLQPLQFLTERALHYSRNVFPRPL